MGLTPLLVITSATFALHAWLPRGAQLALFLAATAVALGVLLAPLQALFVVLLGLGLFGICHLPVAFGLRACLLLIAGAGLAALFTGRPETTWARAVVPVVASMFMFRAAIYLYDLTNERQPAPLGLRLAYFFLLPNVCFLLFPVVDYRTFQRTWLDAPAARIHARGTQWMLRGVLHLLAYRAVYLWLTPSVSAVQDLGGVVRFVLSSFLLFLRISGHFHLVVGILHLFGFHLPETNHRYLFATSFTDCWRRMNVYWMEFLKKLVYFPVFARLRSRGTLFAMATATAATFLLTWILHVYQWFWLHGSLPLVTDGLFWGVAGLLAVGNLVLDARSRGGASLKKSAPGWGTALRLAVQSTGILITICLAWSLWSSASPDEWLSVLAKARGASGRELGWLAGGLAAWVGVVALTQRVGARPFFAMLGDRSRGPAATTFALVALALLGFDGVRERLPERVARAVSELDGNTLNTRDRERLVAGYYDRLIDRERFGARVEEEVRLAAAEGDDPEVFRESDVAAEAEGPLGWALEPSAEGTFQEAVVTTNSFGMRDREYTLEKPDGVLRIAVLGACYEMGGGVANDEVWEAVAEELLTERLAAEGRRVEILNFSVPGYDMLRLVTLLREKVPPFAPDVVAVSNHVRSSVGFLLDRHTDEADWPTGLKEMVERTREEQDVDWEARLEDWAFGEIVTLCASVGADPVLLNVPPLEELRGLMTPAIRERIDGQLDRARRAGCLILDLGTAFAGESYDDVSLPGIQGSPNVRGHRLLAERFVEVLANGPLLGSR